MRREGQLINLVSRPACQCGDEMAKGRRERQAWKSLDLGHLHLRVNQCCPPPSSLRWPNILQLADLLLERISRGPAQGMQCGLNPWDVNASFVHSMIIAAG